jgi:FemAB-related protein (PEP-CTERM system-associated)
VAIQIRPLTLEEYAKWDEFVRQHPQGSEFHLTAWKKTIEEIFGYRSCCALATEDTAVRGVLPLFCVQNLIVGKVLISSPFAVYGGILADSPESREALYEYVRNLGKELKVGHIDLRNAYPEQCLGMPNVSRYVTFTRPVPSTEEELLGSIHKKTRNMVRKALKSPFSTRRQTDDYQAFEDLHSKNLRRLGTPNFPASLFPALLKNFAGMIDIREVVLEDRVVAASMNFYFRERMHTYYAASDGRYLHLAPNDYMYFDQLRWAGTNGYRTYDFGRSKLSTGTFEFKRHWGGIVRELPYEVLLVNRKDMPNYSPTNPKFHIAIKVWQNLPLSVTRALGPSLVRLFP